MIFKSIIIAMLLVILFSLAAAMFSMLKNDADSNRTVKALTFRIGLSIALVVILLAGSYMGLISPRHM